MPASRTKRFLGLLLGAAVLLSLPARPPSVHAQGNACGPFTDVPGADLFCPFILQSFNLGITNGTSATTFSPDSPVPRSQMVTFFDRAVDLTLHRGQRTAIGRTWAATATAGGISADMGGAINDVVSDGTFLWLARSDSAILKVSTADRRVLETWHITAGAIPTRLGIYAGLVWIADQQGNLYFFDPSQTPTTKSLWVVGASGGYPAMAFDGTNVWLGGSSGNKYFKYQVGGANNFFFTAAANVDSLAFDGTFMWMLLSNGHLQRLNTTAQGVAPTVAEDITLPGVVGDCRMIWDGNFLWIPEGPSGRVLAIRPAQGSFPSLVALNQSVVSNFPYGAAFDGENVMVGGVNDGTVHLFKASSLTFLRSFPSGAGGVRGIASDGLTFNIGDASGAKLFQF